MNKNRFFLVLLVAILLVAATGASNVAARADDNRIFKVRLSGANEVPPVITEASGSTAFKLNSAGTEIKYRIVVKDLENATAAHIHCGAEGVNGSVAVLLFSGGPISMTGVLAHGTITEANVIPLPDSAACPGGIANLADLLAKMQTEDVYVNVHTTQTPTGEMRGQIK